MDKFTLIIGIIGLLLLVISLVVIICAIVNIIKRKTTIKKFLSSFIIFLITFAFATSFIYLSLFLQTFSRYTCEQKIGWVYAEKIDETIKITYCDEGKNRIHWFDISGDQWMVDGYFLRWNVILRWLGAGSHYRVTRFTGRWEKPEGKVLSVYQIHPESKLWKFLLKNGEKIPIVDAAYGIGTFQYPNQDTFLLYINDTGFILRTK